MENGGGGGGGDVPRNANEHCPRTQSEAARKAESCAGCPNQQICATAPKGPDPVETRSSEIGIQVGVVAKQGVGITDISDVGVLVRELKEGCLFQSFNQGNAFLCPSS